MSTTEYPKGSIGHALQSRQVELYVADPSTTPIQSTSGASRLLESPWLAITHDWPTKHQGEKPEIWGTIFRVAPSTGAELYLRIGRQAEFVPGWSAKPEGQITIDPGSESPSISILDAVLNAEASNAGRRDKVLSMQVEGLISSEEPRCLLAMSSWDLYVATLDEDGQESINSAPVSVQLSIGQSDWLM